MTDRTDPGGWWEKSLPPWLAIVNFRGVAVVGVAIWSCICDLVRATWRSEKLPGTTWVWYRRGWTRGRDLGFPGFDRGRLPAGGAEDGFDPLFVGAVFLVDFDELDFFLVISLVVCWEYR
jgi:hypothetical protein